MNRIYEVTVGDTVEIKGPIVQDALGAITDLTGWVVTFSLIKIPAGVNPVTDQAANIASWDVVNKTFNVTSTYTFATAGRYKVRWRVINPQGKWFASPSPLMDQTIIQVNP